ncbi:Translin-associated factor X-interacting protein 1 [Allomyces javanicus]|nr:Translin-associated factor X-interacting protein 1 [Allomyces javanicus]
MLRSTAGFGSRPASAGKIGPQRLLAPPPSAPDTDPATPPSSRAMSRPGSARPTSRPSSARTRPTVRGAWDPPPPVDNSNPTLGPAAFRTASGDPALLVELTRFVRRELLELGADTKPPGDAARLSVHRNAFQIFIEDFKTYRALLSDIKNEYERALARLEAQVREIPALESQLALHKYEVAEKQAETVKELVRRVGDVKNDSDHWAKEAARLQTELGECRRRCDLLAADVRDKSARLKEEEISKTILVEAEHKLQGTVQDFVRRVTEQDQLVETLQRQNALLLESNRAAEDKIAELKEAYKDTVPKYEHELLRAEHDSYKSRFEHQQNMTVKMHQQVLDSQQKHEQILRDLEKRFAERLKHATPDWDYVAKRCSGNIEVFWSPCNGMNANETIITLIHMCTRYSAAGGVGGMAVMQANANGGGTADHRLSRAGSKGTLPTSKTGSRLSLHSVGSKAGGRAAQAPVGSLKGQRQAEEKQAFFLGLGLAAHVPRYLRFKGRVPNRHLTRQNCCLLIRDVWATKAVFDQDKKRQGKPSHLSEYFYLYLKKRFSMQDAIAEWGYNVVEACRQYKKQSTDCWLFLDILEDRLNESVYAHVHQLVETLRTSFARLDANLNDGIATGRLAKTVILSTLQEMWKHKTPAQVAELTTALDADQPGSNDTTYPLFFRVNADSAFVEAVKLQEMEERSQYMQDLENAVYQYHGASVTALTTVEFSRIIGRFDLDKKKADVDEYVARGYNSTVDKLRPRDTMTIGKFLANLSRGVLKRG